MSGPAAPAPVPSAVVSSPAQPAQLTEYVILEAVRVPADALEKALGGPDASVQSDDGDGHVTLWLPLRNQTAKEGPDGEVRIVKANAPANAIKLATKMDGEDNVQRPGTFKSVPLRSWKGGRTYTNKQKLVTDAEDFTD